MDSYILSIETGSSIMKITKPVKAKVIDIVLRCVVKVMDDEGKWHIVGHCFFESEAEEAANAIQQAIKTKIQKIFVNIS